MELAQFLSEIRDREPNVENVRVTRWYAWHPRRTAQEVALLLPMVEATARAQQGATDATVGAAVNPLLDSLRPTTFEVAKPCPLDESTRVFAIFHDAESIRVYCAKMGGAQPDKPKPPMCFTLSHTGPQYTIDYYPSPTVWLDVIADEFDDVIQATATYTDEPKPSGTDEEEEEEDETDEPKSQPQPTGTATAQGDPT